VQLPVTHLSLSLQSPLQMKWTIKQSIQEEKITVHLQPSPHPYPSTDPHLASSQDDMTEEQQGNLPPSASSLLPTPYQPAHPSHYTTTTVQMSSGLTAVRAVLGSSTPITDREIRSALWDSYFDVDGTVAFLLGESSIEQDS